MENAPESPVDKLWQEYSSAFGPFDDLTLARWLAQTLGQIEGRVWRFSHPLLGAYRLAANLAHERQIWLKRLVKLPAGYTESECCRAPLLPLFTRDVIESGLDCVHCTETAVPFADLPSPLQAECTLWSAQYAPVHAVAHWDDRQRKKARDYDQAYENAACAAEKLLGFAAKNLMPKFLDTYPAIVWEDQDECLEVRPEDIEL
jgi:hypothetical protein